MQRSGAIACGLPLAALILFLIACAHPESKDISEKLRAGCNDESSCAAIVAQAKAAYPKCVASRGQYECAEYDDLYRKALESYFDHLLEPRTKQCTALSSPKGDSSWALCVSANKDIEHFIQGDLEEYKGHASQEIPFHSPDRQKAIDYALRKAERYHQLAVNACITGCKSGGQDECCAVVNGAIEAAEARRNAPMQAVMGATCKQGCADNANDCLAKCNKQDIPCGKVCQNGLNMCLQACQAK